MQEVLLTCGVGGSRATTSALVKTLTRKILVFTMILILIGVWFAVSTKTANSAPQYMEFRLGEGLEKIEQEKQQAIAKALEEYKKQKLLAYKNELNQKAQKLKGKWQGQCVVAVRKFIWGQEADSDFARSQIKGLAAHLKTNTQTPEIGAIIKLETGYTDHVGVVLDYNDQYITYYDSNGDWTERAAIRSIKTSDQKILGFKIIKI